MTNPGSHSQGCSCLPRGLQGLDKYLQLSTSFQPTSNWEAAVCPVGTVDAMMPSMVPGILWAIHRSWTNNIIEEATTPPHLALSMNSMNT